ncbi:MAG TPA: ATP-binding protein [Acidobacteriota bacterium]|nr:ATP-binding protein [Acidobacteriota bacterium]
MEEREGVEVAVPCPRCSADNKRRRLLAQARIPPRYRDKTFENYRSVHESQRKAHFMMKNFADKYPLEIRGVLLIGPTGVGKTHLAIAALNHLISRKLVAGKFVDEKVLLKDLQYSYGPDSRMTERELMVPLSEVDVLVWDDLGASRGTEWARETIDTILNDRYLNQRPTILTSNILLHRPSRRPAGDSVAERPRPAENLESRIGKRLFSRLNEMCRILRVSGEDFRRRQDRIVRKTPVQSGLPQRRVDSPKLVCPACGSDAVSIMSEAFVEDKKQKEFYVRCDSCGEHAVYSEDEQTGESLGE